MDNFYLISHDTLFGIAEAIREKNGIDDKINPEEFGFWISNIQGSDGEEDLYKEYLEGSINSSQVLGTNLQKIGPYRFAYNEDIETINNSSIIELETSAFMGCPNLTSAILPNCEIIRSNAFDTGYHRYYSEMDGDIIIENRYTQISLQIPKCIQIEDYGLRKVHFNSINDFPNFGKVEYLGTANQVTKNSGISFEVLSFPKVTHIGDGWLKMFDPIELELPKCESLYYWYYDNYVGEYYQTSSTHNLKNLTTLTLGNCNGLILDQFYGCTSLRYLYLTSPTMVPLLEGTWGEEPNLPSVFSGTKILSGDGLIFVPQELLETYRNNEYWSFLSDQIVPIGQYGISPTISGVRVVEWSSKTIKVGYVYGMNDPEISINGDGEIVCATDVYLDGGAIFASFDVYDPGSGQLIIYLEEYPDDGEPKLASLTIDIEVVDSSNQMQVTNMTTVGSYGFNMSEEPPYYEFTNTNSLMDSTTSEARIEFYIPYDGILNLAYYVDSETCCDKGSISALDSTTYPTNQTYGGTKVSGNLSMEVTEGAHFICLKYRKDGSVSNGEDIFRVQMTFE